jgi:hypothetical protein
MNGFQPQDLRSVTASICHVADIKEG